MAKIKTKDESFSDFISRLMQKRSLLDFAGRLADVPEEKMEEITKELEKIRDSTTDRAS